MYLSRYCTLKNLTFREGTLLNKSGRLVENEIAVNDWVEGLDAGRRSNDLCLCQCRGQQSSQWYLSETVQFCVSVTVAIERSGHASSNVGWSAGRPVANSTESRIHAWVR